MKTDLDTIVKSACSFVLSRNMVAHQEWWAGLNSTRILFMGQMIGPVLPRTWSYHCGPLVASNLFFKKRFCAHTCEKYFFKKYFGGWMINNFIFCGSSPQRLGSKWNLKFIFVQKWWKNAQNPAFLNQNLENMTINTTQGVENEIFTRNFHEKFQNIFTMKMNRKFKIRGYPPCVEILNENSIQIWLEK